MRKKCTGISYEIITMSTTGDKILDVALSKVSYIININNPFFSFYFYVIFYGSFKILHAL